jgi:hypothetical protein
MTTIKYAYRRFCTKRFPLPSEAQLAELEQRIGVVFPDDYRHYILGFNGGYFSEPDIVQVVEGRPQDGLSCMFGMGAPHETAELGREPDLRLFDGNDPPIIVPIGSTALGGLIILITEEEGRGEIWYKEAFGGFFDLADGIAEFFELLLVPPLGSPADRANHG